MNEVFSGTTRNGSKAIAAEMSPDEFRRIAEIALQQAGLTIPEGKIGMIQSRLNRRLRATGKQTFKDYLDFLESNAGLTELPNTISTLTTNVSHFFREDHHFQALESNVFPTLIDRARSGGRVRVWSAGCSSGQEPYSMAMLLLSMAPDISRFDFKILGTDIDREILKVATTGIYEERQMEGIPSPFRQRYLRSKGGGGDSYHISPEVSKLISFRQLNLIGPWPMKSKFDVIFCRNVVIYFSEDTQLALWPRFCEALHPGGLLFLGHSERMTTSATSPFRASGVTTYQKI